MVRGLSSVSFVLVEKKMTAAMTIDVDHKYVGFWLPKSVELPKNHPKVIERNRKLSELKAPSPQWQSLFLNQPMHDVAEHKVFGRVRVASFSNVYFFNICFRRSGG